MFQFSGMKLLWIVNLCLLGAVCAEQQLAGKEMGRERERGEGEREIERERGDWDRERKREVEREVERGEEIVRESERGGKERARKDASM